MTGQGRAEMGSNGSSAGTQDGTSEEANAALKRDVPDATDKTVASVLGEIVWLMSQSPAHKQFLIGDLEWLVMPPVLLRQFRMFYHEGKPAAVVLYAFVSEDVERRIEAGAPSMLPDEWKSGERAWIVQVVAPFGNAEAFSEEACKTVLKGRPVKMQVHGASRRVP
jgi:cytolysin-activating lysine-acyltransferase